MASQYDWQAGLDISSLASVTQAQLLQMINQAAPLSNIGGVLTFDGLSAGAAGVGFPDVTSNPRFVRYIWLDTNSGGLAAIDRSSPVFKRYVGAYTGTPANPLAMSNLYTDWVAVGIGVAGLTTAMVTARGATGGIDIGKLKRASDGSADATKAYYLVAVDSAGQYIEMVSLDSALQNGGGVALTRISTVGIGDGKYLGYSAGLAYKDLNPAVDFTLAKNNRIPVSTAIQPGTAKYLLRTNAAALAAEWVATNDNTLFNAGDIPLASLVTTGAALNDVVYYTGAAWARLALSALINNSGSSYYPGTLLSNATKYIETGVLASMPKHIRGSLVCTTADGSFAVGDEIDAQCLGFYNGANRGLASNLFWRSVASKIRFAFYQSVNFEVGSFDGTAVPYTLTPGSWAPKIYYWL